MKIEKLLNGSKANSSELNESLPMALYGLMQFYNEMKSIISVLNAASGKKGHLNDAILGNSERRDMELLRAEVDKLPEAVRGKIIVILKKVGISLTGVSLSRENHIRKIVMLKCVRLVFFGIGNALQDPTEAMLMLLSSGLGTIYSIVANIKDGRDVLIEMKRIGKLCMEIRANLRSRR